MPITFFSKRCPGAQRLGSCCWSTDLLGQPASIRQKRLFCEICMAIKGLDSDRELLQVHLADLYTLDTDQFRKARTAIGDCVFDAIGAGVLNVLTGAVPSLKRAREDQRKVSLARTLSLLTDGSWLIHCWNKRIAEDTRDICRCEAALSQLPIPIRGTIYEFMCADTWTLYAHLCSVKRRGYHTLEQPIFWHPARDFHESNAEGSPSARTMLIGVYSYIVKHVHKPKLESLKRSLVKHAHFIKRNWAMQRYGHTVRKAIDIVDCMLDREIGVVGEAPFDIGPAA